MQPYAMKNSVLFALATSSLLLLSGLTGRAITIERWLPNGKYLSGEPGTTEYTDSLDITKKGYDSKKEKVTFAELWIEAKDDEVDDPWESGSVYLGDRQLVGPKKIGLDPLNGEVSGDALGKLDKDGIIKFTVRREEGDFLYWQAKLVYETSSRSVPDGGATGPVTTVPDNSSTLLLLGTTVLVLGLASRRFSIH
jgi:hypothetical protein